MGKRSRFNFLTRWLNDGRVETVEYTLCSTITKPKNIAYASTKGTEVYSVALSTPVNGSSCTCRGFVFGDVCKHIKDAENTRCRFIHKGDTDLTACPLCGAELDYWEEDVKFI